MYVPGIYLVSYSYSDVVFCIPFLVPGIVFELGCSVLHSLFFSSNFYCRRPSSLGAFRNCMLCSVIYPAAPM